MKLSIFTAVAALLFGIAGSAQAIEPYATAYSGWGAPSSYYYPTSSSVYTVSPSYGAYGSTTYPGYSTYPQYNSSWSYPSYQTPTYTYDSMHGDYHLNRGNSLGTWNGGYATGSQFNYGNGHFHGRRW